MALRRTPEDARLTGVGGWLLYYVITSLVGAGWWMAQISLSSPGDVMAAMIEIPFHVLGIVVAVYLWRIKPGALGLLRFYLYSVCLFGIAVFVFLLAEARPAGNPFRMVLLGIGTLGTGIWILYFRTSKRVKLTYGANL